MSIQQILLALGGFAVDGADFDGTNDYMTRGAGLTGAADSKTGILSAWVRVDGGNASNRMMLASISGIESFSFSIATDNNIYIQVLDASVTEQVLLMHSTTANFTSSAAWRHILASWDIAASATHMYVDGASSKTVDLLTNLNGDYTATDWRIGANLSAGAKFNGCMAEFYFATGQYLDFSVASNREKFRSAAGKPVFLGLDGSIPTGTAPIVFQHLNDAENVANFATNRGSGGNFTITGTLDTASTSPSD